MRVHHLQEATGRDTCTRCGFLIGFYTKYTLVEHEDGGELRWERFHPSCWQATRS